MGKKFNKMGLNFGEVMLVVFIILKLTKVIDWSWWWVVSPLWISYILAFICVCILAYFKNR